MVDIAKVVVQWRDGSREDWEVAGDLVRRGHARHGLFFAHLALEKVLKAHVCRHTRELAPRLHDLVRLAALSGLDLGGDRLDVLAKMNAYSLAGRYPDMLPTPVAAADAEARLAAAAEVLEWLTSRL